MRYFSRRLVWGVLLGLLPVALMAQTDAIQVAKTMIAKVEQVNGLMYSQEKWERVDGEMSYGSAIFKVQVSPFRVYMKQYAPREGTEVIYKQGWNDNDAKVNAGRFIPNLNLAPNGSRMRDGNHHAITNAGFLALTDVTKAFLKEYGNDASKYLTHLGTVSWDGRSCHKIEMKLPNWGWKNYTVKAGEDLFKIADKFKLSEYMILEGNADVDDYDDVKAGQTIRIPTDYAKRTVVYVDKEHYMPVRTMVYDDKGLYERYEFKSVFVNPPLSSDDFDIDNDAYGF